MDEGVRAMERSANIRSGMCAILSVFIFAVLWPAFPMTAAAQDINFINAIEQVAKKAIPSVAHVEVMEKQKVTNPLMPFQNDPFFKYFFGNPKMPKSFEKEVVGLGSGIIVDAQGHILTNSHVVNGATKIVVVLSDGRRYTENKIKLIGVDPKTDLAVIQILDKEGFPPATFGDSDQVDVGQWVVAIGHPQGLDQTVTQGIISAKHRHGIGDPTSYQDFLQTDAAINPGNSGGPLLNLRGEVIGVNAAIISGSGGFEGIGFAIPSNLALHVTKQLIATGKVERGWVGITIQQLTPELASSFGLSSAKGVLIASVLKDGPAEAAGLKQGDVIVAYDGKEVQNPDVFRNEVANAPVGRTVTLSILRNGNRQDIPIKVSSSEDHEKIMMSSILTRYGVEVKPIDQKEKERYNLDSNKGVFVTHVLPKKAFARAGIEVGDVILQVDQQEVTGPEEFGAILSLLPPRKKVILAVIDVKTKRPGLVKLTAP